MNSPALAAACTLLLAGAAIAQSGNPAPMPPLAKHDPRLATLLSQANRTQVPTGVALSPDGAFYAWTIRTGDHTSLRISSVRDAVPTKAAPDSLLNSSTCSNTAPAWSPDSQNLAFTSTCGGKDDKPEQDQIFVWSRATGATRQLTHLAGIFQQAAFSPDGKSLAFLFVENATRSAGALAPMKPWSGVIGEDGVEIQRVAIADVGSGNITMATPSSLHVYEFSWQPDGKAVAMIAATPPGENTWWIAKLYTQQLGASPGTGPIVVFDPNTTSTALHGLQIAVPRFSPDGKRIAFIGGLMSDQGSTGGDVWVVPAAGGQPVDVTPGIDGSPAYIVWQNNQTIGFSEDRSGHSLLAAYDVDTRSKVGSVDLGESNVTGGPIKMAVSVASTGAVAFVRSSHDAPPEIWAGDPQSLKQVTHLNDGLKPRTRVESIEWENEGFHIQGWLAYPKDYDASKKYPLIVNVHGGPSASASARWDGYVWPEMGYFQFDPNPRGSFGQGEKFTAANIKDFGYGDLHDILKGMDAIEKKVSIDTHREGLTGWSYGGFMTMFAVSQTHRFRAAVAGAGIANWKSYYGENSIDQWMVPFFGATVYDDPAVYAKSSAIEFIKNVKTPTLVIVGDRDGECPGPQSFEFWHALRAEGVKTQLVVYPNEGHGFRDPGHIRDREERVLAWFESEMPPS